MIRIIRLDYRAMHRFNKSIVLLMVLSLMNVTRAASLDEEHAGQIDRAAMAGIELEMAPGMVVIAGRADGNVYEKAYGRMTYAADARPVFTSLRYKRLAGVPPSMVASAATAGVSSWSACGTWNAMTTRGRSPGLLMTKRRSPNCCGSTVYIAGIGRGDGGMLP
jgi:hypothetical protein